MSLQKRVHEIVEVAKDSDRASRVFDVFLMALIAANVVAVTLESVEGIQRAVPRVFHVFEVASVLVFAVEYVLRVWSCVQSPQFSGPLRGRLRFAVTPMAVCDLVAILPFFMTSLGLDFRFVRAFRLLRLFRIAKLGRYSSTLQLLGRVLEAKAEGLVVTLFVLSLLLIVASSLMYFAEHEAQPEVFSSVPAAMWWGVATLTTVGYGDAYPITVAGKLIASVIALLGIGLFALPAGMLAAGFIEEFQGGTAARRTCPHCGAEMSSH